MAFKIFQTATATMSRKVKDRAGDVSDSVSFTVKIDPDISDKVVYSDQGRTVVGGETIISVNENIDPTSKDYTLDINGQEYRVEQIKPVHHIGSNKVSHYEVILR